MSKPVAYALCIKTRCYPSALEIRKVYQVLPDRNAEARGLVRVVDESGEDYLYPSTYFVSIAMPRQALTVFRKRTA